MEYLVNNITGIIAMVLAVLNFMTLRSRSNSQNYLDNSSGMQSLNQSITLANARALKAEEDNFLLEKRIASLENRMSYRLVFDVNLGTNPSVESVEITHIEERRVKEVEIPHDRRKNLR